MIKDKRKEEKKIKLSASEAFVLVSKTVAQFQATYNRNMVLFNTKVVVLAQAVLMVAALQLAILAILLLKLK